MPSITTEAYVFAGLKYAIIYALNTYNRPAATNGVAYTGLPVWGSKTYNLTIPPARRVAHIGNDRLLKQQTFPPTDPASGELNVGATDLDIIKVLTGATAIKEFAGMQMLPHLSDLQGNEPNVGIIMYQAAVAKSGSKRWRFHFIPSTKAIVREPGAGPDPIDLIFDLSPDPVDQFPWGAELAPLSDPSDPYSGVSATGATEAGIWSGFSAFRPRLASFIAQADQVLFEFPDNLQAANITDVAVTTVLTTGTPVVEDAADYTVTTAGVTFDTAPVTTYGAGVEVIIAYQIADTATE